MLTDKNAPNGRIDTEKYLNAVKSYNARLRASLQRLQETANELDQALANLEEKENQIGNSTDTTTADKPPRP